MKKDCFSILLLGYILMEAGSRFLWQPLIWIGIPVFFIGLLVFGKCTWTRWRNKTLSGWRLWLKIFVLLTGIIYFAISVIHCLSCKVFE